MQIVGGTSHRSTCGKVPCLTFFDKLISLSVMGIFTPAVTTICFWWGSIPLFRDDRVIMVCMLTGLLIGILLDLTLLRKHLLGLFDLSFIKLILLSLFYSAMIYGFFMGFPVFNSLVGIVGSYVLVKGGSLRYEDIKLIKSKVKIFVAVSSLSLLLLCIVTAWLALKERTICLQVKGMLGLPFDVTMGMIWALIIIGSAFLLAFQYLGSMYVMGRMLERYGSDGSGDED